MNKFVQISLKYYEKAFKSAYSIADLILILQQFYIFTIVTLTQISLSVIASAVQNCDVYTTSTVMISINIT